MKVYSRIDTYQPRLNFRSNIEEVNANNIDEYLKANRVTLKQSYEDLLIISEKATQERAGLLHLKRTINEQKEAAKLSGEMMHNPFDLINQFEESAASHIKRITDSQKLETTGIIGEICPEESYIKSFCYKGAGFYREGIANSGFINTIRPVELNFNAIAGFGGPMATKNFERLFLTFKDEDSLLFKNAIGAFSEVSKRYFSHTGKRVKEVKDMYSKSQKWGERIPGAGLGLKVGRVSEQQQYMKYIYRDYCEYCDTFIHKGVHQIAQSYVHKIKQAQTNIELMSPYLSNADLVFVNKVVENMKKIAKPLTENYLKLLSTVTDNGENIASYYRAVNSNGNISSIIKVLKTCVLLS